MVHLDISGYIHLKVEGFSRLQVGLQVAGCDIDPQNLSESVGVDGFFWSLYPKLASNLSCHIRMEGLLPCQP